MDYRTTSAYQFRTRLRFKQYDVILTKEQSVLTKTITSFEGGDMQIQYNALSYNTNYKPAIEIDENGHRNRNIDYEIKRQKTIKKELAWKFIKIHPDKEDFDIFRTINQIFRHIKQSNIKTLITKISTWLSGLEFKSDNIIKSKAWNLLLNFFFLIMSNNGNV